MRRLGILSNYMKPKRDRSNISEIWKILSRILREKNGGNGSLNSTRAAGSKKIKENQKRDTFFGAEEQKKDILLVVTREIIFWSGVWDTLRLSEGMLYSPDMS